jgi:ornithine cyclodeaminase
MRVLGRDFVREHLTYPAAIGLVREGMIALSRQDTIQPLRSILHMAAGRMFGVMPGALGEDSDFGAKLVSVFPGNTEKGLQSHQGGILMFDPESGMPTALVHAGEVTAIRTAAASAAATDVLARADASRLAIIGYGEQAASHIRAMAHIRPLSTVTIAGRSAARAEAFAAAMAGETGLDIHAAADIRTAVENADIVCTVTAAREPLVKGDWLAPGSHINIVGSSYAGPAEVDNTLVAKTRFIADHRAGVIEQGAEFINAKAAGLVDDSHIAGEIGEVYLSRVEGRPDPDCITAYKSLGHIVQDLACGRFLEERARAAGVPALDF